MQRRNLLPLIALLFAGAVAACRPSDADSPPPVRPVLNMVVEAEGGGSQAFAGTVEPRVKTALGFQVLGQLVARHVDTGDVVKAGTVVAEIDPTALDLNVRAAEATLGSRSAEAENARAAAARADALKASGTAPPATWEQAHTALDAAEASLRQAQSDLAKAKDARGYASLTADFDGVVTATGAEVGQTVAAGQMVVTLAKPDLRDAVIDIPDWTASDLSPGTSFRVALQIAPDITVAGTLREIAPQSDAATRSRRLKIALDNPSEFFRLGSTIYAARVTDDHPRIVLPESALLVEAGASYVWVVTSDASGKGLATVNKRAVTAERQGDRLVATAGLAAGERIATAGVHSLTDGQTVRIGD